MKNAIQLNPGISYKISKASNYTYLFSITFVHWNNLSFHPTKIENNEAGLLSEDVEMPCPDHLETEPALVSVNPKLLLYPLDHADDTTKYRIWEVLKCKCITKFQVLL